MVGGGGMSVCVAIAEKEWWAALSRGWRRRGQEDRGMDDGRCDGESEVRKRKIRAVEVAFVMLDCMTILGLAWRCRGG